MIREDIIKIAREKETIPDFKLEFNDLEFRTEKTKANIETYLLKSDFDLERQQLFYDEVSSFVKELDISYVENYELEDSSCDIYVEERRIGFKFLGLFDFSEINVLKKNQLNTYNTFTKNDKKIVQIFEDTWFKKKDIIKSRIKNILGLSDKKIYATKTKIKELNSKKDTKIISDFLVKNHSQGKVGGKYKFALMFEDEIVSLMTFGSLRKNMGQISKIDSYELLRFVNKLNTNVIGGASKLFKYFVKKYNVNSVISYADKNWSNSKNNLYTSLGLDYVHDSDPSYFYVVGDLRKGRFGYRKDVLLTCGYDGSHWGEHTICLINDIYRIYDVGTAKYEYTNQNYILDVIEISEEEKIKIKEDNDFWD